MSDVTPGIGAVRDHQPEVEARRVHRLQRRQHVVVGNQLRRDADRAGEIEQRRGGQAAAPEERVDLPVLERVDRGVHAQALLADVLVGIEARGAQQAERDHLGAAARRARGDDAPAQIGEAVDVLPLDRRDVRVVRIEHRQRPRLDGRFGERPAPADRVVQRVGEHERDVGLAELNQLQVVDRGVGDLGGGIDVRNGLADDARQPAAVRVIDAAGVAGGDRQPHRAAVFPGVLTRIEARRGKADGEQDEGAEDDGRGVVMSWNQRGILLRAVI